MAKILITGAVGFIGFHVAKRLLGAQMHEIVALDSFNPANPTKLTCVRENLLIKQNLIVKKIDLLEVNSAKLFALVGEVDLVVHLAAFPGVRISKEREEFNFYNNIKSFETVCQFSRLAGAKLIYASSSSVYGDSGLEGACVESSLHELKGKGTYAKSKWENEIFANNLFASQELDSIGLRLFSVYGTFGREDMAYFEFARRFIFSEQLEIFDSIDDYRDYTPVCYVVDDIEHLINKVLSIPNYIRKDLASIDGNTLINIGSGNPIQLARLIYIYEEIFKKRVEITNLGRNSSESKRTWSDNSKRNTLLPGRSDTTFEDEISKFTEWIVPYLTGKI